MNIDKNEVLRYLGYKDQVLDDKINNLIDECIDETLALADYKYIYKVFSLDKDQDGIQLINSNLLVKGKDIVEHLKYSNQCAVMALTLGNAIENKIRLYEKTNLTKALIVDACATAAVEAACDEVEERIRTEAQAHALHLTSRYSPGYGDFDISVQHQLLNVLEAQKKIGLSCSEDFILLPRKSVTALIGFQKMQSPVKKTICNECNKFNTCYFKKGGCQCVD